MLCIGNKHPRLRLCSFGLPPGQGAPLYSPKGKYMEGRPAAWQSVLSIRWLLCALLTVPSAVVLHGQGSRSPQDLLREAQSLHQAGKLDQAIEDYRLILKDYPDVAQVRSNLGAALASAGRYEEAIVEYNRALKLSALPQIRLNLALASRRFTPTCPTISA